MKKFIGALLSILVAGSLSFTLASTAFSDMMEKGKKMDSGKMMEHKEKMGMEKMKGHARTGTISPYKGHSASGTASITQDMGHTFLELTNIRVDKVPDGHVYLTKGTDHTTGLELGLLEQFTGNVRFPIPGNVKTGEYDSVVIWCNKFDVGIGKATLSGGMMK
jgi:hypothetical protein